MIEGGGDFPDEPDRNRTLIAKARRMWVPARVAVIVRGAGSGGDRADAADVLVVEAVGADVVAAVVRRWWGGGRHGGHGGGGGGRH